MRARRLFFVSETKEFNCFNLDRMHLNEVEPTVPSKYKHYYPINTF